MRQTRRKIAGFFRASRQFYAWLVTAELCSAGLLWACWRYRYWWPLPDWIVITFLLTRLGCERQWFGPWPPKDRDTP